MFTVYVLRDPDGEPRYVGLTSLTLAERLQGHKTGGRVAQWIRRLHEDGQRPTIEPLQTLPGITLLSAAHIVEDAWIVRLLSDGACLMNEKVNTYFGSEEYAPGRRSALPARTSPARPEPAHP